MLSKTRNSDPAETNPDLRTQEGKTIIGKQVSIEGSIRGKENLVIEGTLKGNIDLADHQVTIGNQGKVDGEIYAENITISGHLSVDEMAVPYNCGHSRPSLILSIDTARNRLGSCRAVKSGPIGPLIAGGYAHHKDISHNLNSVLVGAVVIHYRIGANDAKVPILG